MSIEVEELSTKRALLEQHEELLDAAREFGATMLDREHTWEELETAARHLDDAAIAHRLAWRRHTEDAGATRWQLSDIVLADRKTVDAPGVAERFGVDAATFAERAAALYAAADAVADLLSAGAIPVASDAARSVLGRAAVEWHLAALEVSAFTVTLVPANATEPSGA